MLPQRPSTFDLDFAPNISHGEAVSKAAQRTDHPCQICPTCSQRLSEHHCKLVCTQCGYYMSCADFY
jgi:hypothetical protein